MQQADDISTTVARTLGIPVARVTPELSFSDIPEWDSLNHVNLMLALERLLKIEITEDHMVELTTVQAIRDFAAAHRRPA